jgi:cob(I)alamin adenosyltransferase
MLASEEKDKNIHIPIIYEQDSEYLEREMDRMDATLPPMRSFVLPGGHPAVSFCHISRCVCRRAERHAVRLSSLEEVPSVVIVFLNRLSDYLFLLSREWSHVLNIQETPWKPQKNKN